MDTREERKKQIKKHLNSMKAAEVKMYHFLLRKTFLSNQDFRIAADGVYFDCAEPSARMLRASLAEDESHLHGKLSQVKFDNTSVC